jgi:hypothetical protein
MKSLAEFKASLNSEQPVSGLSVQLKSLWYDGKGDWHQAHAQVDRLSDRPSAWIHAYLHRKKAILEMPITGIAEQVKYAKRFPWKRNGNSWF